MFGKYVVNNPEDIPLINKSLLGLEVLISVVGVLLFIDIVGLEASEIGSFMLLSGIVTLIIHLVGSKLLHYRTMLLRRSIVDYYRNSVTERPDDIDAEIKEKVEIMTIGYIDEHIGLVVLGILSSFVIGMYPLIMEYFGLIDFSFLEINGFVFLGLVGYLVIILYFYKSYSYDPDELMNENLHNYRRVSATGRN